MTKNMGTTDRAVRVVVAIVIAGLYLTGTISGVTATVLAIIAVVLFLTSLAGTCPAYMPFHISTRKKSSPPQ